MGETVSKWRNAIQKLWPVVDRLMLIQIEHLDFRDLIPRIDFDGAFFYEDPPYHEEARGSFNDYKHEFSDRDHEELAEINHHVKGKVMISGYDCDSMQRLYKHWNFYRLPMRQNNIRKKPVQECIWMNYDPAKVYGQLSIYDMRVGELKN